MCQLVLYIFAQSKVHISVSMHRPTCIVCIDLQPKDHVRHTHKCTTEECLQLEVHIGNDEEMNGRQWGTQGNL